VIRNGLRWCYNNFLSAGRAEAERVFMSGKGKETAQRLLAIIVIVAMLALMGIPPTVIIFFALVVFFVWRAVDRAEQNDTRRIFDFYIAANEVLRDEDRRWYGFEIAGVIARGENILRSMNDAPPLLHFALGALYHCLGDNRAAAEHLAFVLENEQGDERRRFAPSPELRRYVETLRRLEREPAEGPQSIAAFRSLDRLRRQRAESLLAESRERLKAQTPPLEVKPAPVETKRRAVSAIYEPIPLDAARTESRLAEVLQTKNEAQESAEESNIVSVEERTSQTNASARGKTLVARATPPPPITEVLRDLYDEEKKTA
jgi:hypothetical protein